MKKLIKYILVVAVIGMVGYNSVYVKKLSEVKNKDLSKFDAVDFSKKLWDEQLPGRLDTAIELSAWINAIKTDSIAGMERVSNAMAIGNYRYSLVKIKGRAGAIGEDDFILNADSQVNIKVATEFIYGNAIRDASGLVDIRNFVNTNDLNNISEELNKKVRTTVLPALKRNLKPGALLEITGAIEFNKEHLRLKDLEMIPVRIKFLN